MRILYTNFHPGDGGGHTTYILALARALVTRHEVHVAAPPGSRLLREAMQIQGVHAFVQPFPGGSRALVARRPLAAYLRAHQFDIVHVNGSSDHRLTIAAARGLPQRPRIVFTKHNSKPMRSLGNWWRARQGTDAVIAVSDYTLRALQASPYRRCRLACIRNGIALEHYAPWPQALAQTARTQWIGDPAALVLGSSAGTADYKGWIDLVEAIALLPAELRAQVHMLLAGEPPTARHRARIEALNLAGQVHFAGLLRDVRPLIAASDVGFVLSWDVETISFACREMMAMGKPVLLTDYAGLPENIEAGCEGWLVPVRNPAAIAGMLREILAAREMPQAMGVAAHARAMAEFGNERFTDATVDFYRQVLSDGT